MKKKFMILLAMVMVISFVACDNSTKKTDTKSLYEQGLEVVQLMSEMAQSEEYMNVYTGNESINNIIQKISEGDYSVPEAAYYIRIDEEALGNMIGLNNLDGISEELQDYMSQRVMTALVSQINAMGGAENLAAASVCTVGKTFVNEEADEDVIFLYVYKNAFPVAVTFIMGENQSWSANGMFLLYEDFTCDTIEDVKNFLIANEINASVVEVK